MNFVESIIDKCPLATLVLLNSLYTTYLLFLATSIRLLYNCKGFLILK